MKLEILNSCPSITETTLVSFEREYNIMLPISYKSFLLEHHGGTPTFPKFEFGRSDKKVAALVRFFLCFDEKSTYSIYRFVKNFEEILPKNLLPIGIDYGSNLICIGVKEEHSGKIFFWDHELGPNEDEEPDYLNVYFIANDFAEFLKNLTPE